MSNKTNEQIERKGNNVEPKPRPIPQPTPIKPPPIDEKPFHDPSKIKLNEDK